VGQKEKEKIIYTLTHPPAPLWPIYIGWDCTSSHHFMLLFHDVIKDKNTKFGKKKIGQHYKLCYLSSIYNFTRSPPSRCSHFVLYIVMVWKKMWKHCRSKDKNCYRWEKTRLYTFFVFIIWI